jgi:hypothetical protein
MLYRVPAMKRPDFILHGVYIETPCFRMSFKNRQMGIFWVLKVCCVLSSSNSNLNFWASSRDADDALQRCSLRTVLIVFNYTCCLL